MSRLLGTAVALVTLISTSASAQYIVNLSGRYLCVQLCATGIGGQPAYITQNGWDMNLLT